MKIIVIGAGKVGGEICRRLARENYDVVAIDEDETAIAGLLASADVSGIVGRGELAAVQKEAGAARAGLVISVTARDETNILCCQVAKALGAKHTIARVRDFELSAQSAFLQETFGIDIMNPEYETAAEISRLLRYPAAATVDYTEKARVEIVSLEIAPGNALIGMNLKEVSALVKLKVLICAVSRGCDVIVPKGDFVFAAGDKVFITGKYLSIDSFMRHCGLHTARVRTAVIIGGGRITEYLAGSLHENGISVKIIEQDKEVCGRLSGELDYAEIICGNGCDKALLKEEGVPDADAVISLTGNDETNIMVSLNIKALGAGKIVTKINNAGFAELADTLGIGAVVSPKAVISGQMLRYVRSAAARDESVLEYYPVCGEAQAVALRIDNPALTGRPLKDIKLRRGVLIVSVLKRSGAPVLPDGNTELDAGDIILVMSCGGKVLRQEDILE